MSVEAECHKGSENQVLKMKINCHRMRYVSTMSQYVGLHQKGQRLIGQLCRVQWSVGSRVLSDSPTHRY